MNPISSGSPGWGEPLPSTRDPLNHRPEKSPAFSLSHGDYFLAVRAFLENDGFEAISNAVAQKTGRAAVPEDLETIQISLVKHGEFYHPAMIEAVVAGKPVLFVLNPAVSQTGRDYIKKEYQTLGMLTAEFPTAYVPQVYAYGEIPSKNGVVIPMFLGQWLDGYHEFHISADPSESSGNIKVWDSENDHFFLSHAQTRDLYARIATVLTHYYDLESFRQIYPWHHAAGDFIVKTEPDGVDVKLVTVRRYAPLLKDGGDTAAGEPGLEQVLQALLVFFVNMSIRMRLDRLDGVGDLVWSDEVAVASTVNGLFEALALKPRIPSLPAPADLCFKAYLSSCSRADLFDLTDGIVSTFDPKMPETGLIRIHLGDHVDALHSAVTGAIKEYTI